MVTPRRSNSSDGPRPLGDPEHLAEAVDLCARGLEAEDVAYAFTVLDSHARNFLRHDQAQAISPRRGRVIKDLGCIVSLADELAGRLEDLDDMGRETLRKVWGPVIWAERRPGGMREEREGDCLVPKHYPDGSLVTVFERADLAGPGDQLHAWDGAPLWRRLRILASVARQARHMLPPDRGGRTNSLTERLGTAKGQLCRMLGEMLLECAERMSEPRQLSGGPAGPLYRAYCLPVRVRDRAGP